VQKKALIIGIDGVPYDLLHEMMDRGLMPQLKEIMRSGYALHKMKASLPDISSVSWTSFMTGVNPGEHGIYGFTQLMPSSYNLFFPNSRHIKAPTFWQTLHSQGKIGRTVVLNLPNTYPAFPIHGLLVSGFVAIDFNKAVYPPDYAASLRKINYIIDVDLQKGRTDKAGFYTDLMESLSIREYTSRRLLKEEAWDIFMLCVTETDRLHHFFFDRKGGPDFDAFYGRLDGLISTMYRTAKEKYGDDFLFLMLSDHGFVPLKKEVNLNVCLKDAGFLKVDNTREYYDRIAAGTEAFVMDPGRVYIHYRDRYPRGHVTRSDGESVKKRLIELFSNFKDEDGAAPIRRIYEKEEIYSGPFAEDAPDLLFMAHDGFDLKGNLRAHDVFSKDVFTGMHSWHNAILVAPAQLEISNDITIEDPPRVVIDYFSQTGGR
jgi:predicted AlkP superfamily phosphohydrolase/phosphomutase